MITRSHVMPYVGQRVVVQSHEGTIHHGILHSVVNDGIYLRPLRGQPRLATGTMEFDGSLAGASHQEGDIEEVFFPFLFFPWWGIGGFWPWGWWW